MIQTAMHAALALPVLNRFAELSRLSSTALIAAVWQGTLLALIAALALRLAPRIPAAARFAIWFAVFSLIAALPFLNHSSVAATNPASVAWLSLDSRWTLVIAGLWAAASLLRAATLIAAALRVRTLARNATPIDVSANRSTSESRRARLCASTDIDRPTVIGFFAPRILIPTWLLEKLTPAEFDHIALHESSHLNRADDWLNLLQKLALVVFPLNPALAWVERRLCFERELACDERVLNILASREDSATGYASSLTTLAGYRLEHRSLARNLALALGALGASASKSARESELGRRVAHILRPTARMKPLHVRLATGAAIAALLFTTTELERSPQLISFAAPSSATQLASADTAASTASVHADLLPGYRAVAARINIPATIDAKPVGYASPHFTASYSRNLASTFSDSTAPRAIPVRAVVRADHMQQQASPHLIAARQPEPQRGEYVVTRWAVFQSADGMRVVRTSAVFTSGPELQSGSRGDISRSVSDTASQSVSNTTSQSDSDTTSQSVSDTTSQSVSDTPQDSDAPAPPARTLRIRQTAQPIPSYESPYAAVPVPGGWLVFQL